MAYAGWARPERPALADPGYFPLRRHSDRRDTAMDFADRLAGLFGPRQRQVSFAKLLDFTPLSPRVQAHLSQVIAAPCELCGAGHLLGSAAGARRHLPATSQPSFCLRPPAGVCYTGAGALLVRCRRLCLCADRLWPG